MDESETRRIIEEAMAEPLKGAVDNQSFENRPIAELIKARDYLESGRCRRRRGFGIRFAKLSAGGAA